MTAENVISANVRMGRPPFDYAEGARERMTEKYGITPENEAEVAARILAEEDARWASSVQEAKERKRKAEGPPVEAAAGAAAAEEPPAAVPKKKVNKFPRNCPLEFDAKHGVEVAFQAYTKPLDEALKSLEAKAASFKSEDFEHYFYSGDVADLKRRMKDNLAMRIAAVKAINAAFEHFHVTAEHFF